MLGRLMRLVPLLTVLALLGTVFAGCTGDDKAAAKEVASTTAAIATVSSDAGSIHGTVVDPELVPIVNADVALQGGETTKTDAGGAFTFNELAPGAYTVIAQKLGYESQAKKVDVAAGEVTDVTLALEPILVAGEVYTEMFPYKGYMQFGFSTPAVTVRPGILLNDKLDFDGEAKAGALDVVNTMVWQSSAPLAAKRFRLDFTMDGGTNTTSDKSPLVNKPRDELDGKKKEKYHHTIWLPYTCVNPTDQACGGDPTSNTVAIVVEQTFDLYTHIFYGGLAPPDFSGVPA